MVGEELGEIQELTNVTLYLRKFVNLAKGNNTLLFMVRHRWKTKSCLIYPRLLVNIAEQETNTEMVKV